MSIFLFYISRPAGSNFTYPTEGEEPPPLVEKAKPPLGEEPDEDESPDREFSGDGGYLSNMVSRWRGSDYESSEDEYAHVRCHRGH
jgi:hypothetical protein